MAFQDAKRTLRVPKTVCNEFEERSVDVDIVLPDYCPDVTTILKCLMRSVVTSSFQNGDRYNVDGITNLRILYLTEDRENIYCYEAVQPFSVSFRCGGALHHRVEIKQDYVNCRAVSPRRMDIHGAFRVCLSAVGEGEINVFADPKQRGVFCKTQTVYETIPVCETDKSFLIDESIDLGVAANRLLYTDVVVSSSEYKLLTNKMIVKGVLGVKATYCSESQMQCTYEEIPFSQIVDVEGLTDAWCCDMCIDVGEVESSLQQLENGGSRLNINAKLTARVHCSRKETADVVLDAYCSAYPIICETMPLHTVSDSDDQYSRVTMQQSIALSEGIVSVEDMWGELKACDHDDSGVTCCILIGVIGRDADGYLTCFERTMDFAVSHEAFDDELIARLIGVKHTLNGDQLRVQPEVELCVRHNRHETINVVSDVVEDAKQAYERTSAAVRIVYVSAGDNLWEIAKKHRADVQDIMAENDLQDMDIQAPTMLMIPML